MLEHYSLGRKICYLLTQPTFMFLLLALTFIFFISTGTQFWITDYQQSVLNLSKEKAYLHFAIAAITGPVLGVLVGGALFTRLGGYNHPKAMPIAVWVISLGGFCGLPAIYFDDPIVVMSFLWLQFFCGGFTMPVLTGILLN